MHDPLKTAATAALQWHLDAGADDMLGDVPAAKGRQKPAPDPAPAAAPRADSIPLPIPSLGGTGEIKAQALALALSCNTLDALRDAVAGFDGLPIRQTATNCVFSDGNPHAPVMLVGEAPGADEDRQGKPFVGVSGQLLDRILACIGLDRRAEEAEKSIYISNILNWRPPGNRTPSPAEIDISLPFIERHIALVRPRIVILCGGVSTKALLGKGEGISKLRGRFHDYIPITQGVSDTASPIPAMATYHPAYLLRTPAQKRAVWQDMLLLQKKIKTISLK